MPTDLSIAKPGGVPSTKHRLILYSIAGNQITTQRCIHSNKKTKFNHLPAPVGLFYVDGIECLSSAPFLHFSVGAMSILVSVGRADDFARPFFWIMEQQVDPWRWGHKSNKYNACGLLIIASQPPITMSSLLLSR